MPRDAAIKIGERDERPAGRRNLVDVVGQQLRQEILGGALKPGGRAQLRLVPKGERKSLENVLEETRLSERWARYFPDFHDPYLHLTPEEYGEVAEGCGLQVARIHTEDKAWDFGSRSAFFAFGVVTFVEWTRHLPEEEKPTFIVDVLDRYRAVAADRPGENNTFKFYQMDITLRV